MSPTCRRHRQMSANFSRKGMSPRHKMKKKPRHTQYTNNSRQVQVSSNVRVPTYHRVFEFELKKQSRYCRHLKTCRDMSSNVMLFRPPGRHNIFLCRRHDQRHVADMLPTRHAMSSNEGLGRHFKRRHSLLRSTLVFRVQSSPSPAPKSFSNSSIPSKSASNCGNSCHHFLKCNQAYNSLKLLLSETRFTTLGDPVVAPLTFRVVKKLRTFKLAILTAP